MSLTITFPEPLATRLQKHSTLLQRPVAEVASTLLEVALPDTATAATDFPFTLEQVVVRIQATPPNPAMIRPAKASLGEYLAQSIAAEDPYEPFDQAEWNRQWDAVEAEMKARDRADDLAEGRL